MIARLRLPRDLVVELLDLEAQPRQNPRLDLADVPLELLVLVGLHESLGGHAGARGEGLGSGGGRSARHPRKRGSEQGLGTGVRKSLA